MASAAGVSEVWIDPGIGFGKNVQHNLALLGAVDHLCALGYPVLMGTSRKSFLGVISPLPDGSPAPVDDRGPASLATATWALAPGASMIRVHDVAASVQAAALVGSDGAARRAASEGQGREVMKGKWAAGIPPRNFTWVIKDRLAVSERPGGFAPNHRKVRRQEEIIWLQVQGFTWVVSLLPSPHNLQAYQEQELPSVHFPLPQSGDTRAVLARLVPRVARPPHRRGTPARAPRGAG